jgi:hypothetical protein
LPQFVASATDLAKITLTHFADRHSQTLQLGLGLADGLPNMGKLPIQLPMRVIATFPISCILVNGPEQRCLERFKLLKAP